MWLAIAGMGFAFVVAMVLLSRMGRARKQQAQEDLEREREATKAPDILTLVNEEVVELGLDKLDGSKSIDPSVLLQVYRRDIVNCQDPAILRFVLADGVDPANASQETLALRCD
jgi:hypothetical protein